MKGRELGARRDALLQLQPHEVDQLAAQRRNQDRNAKRAKNAKRQRVQSKRKNR